MFEHLQQEVERLGALCRAQQKLIDQLYVMINPNLSIDQHTLRSMTLTDDETAIVRDVRKQSR